MLRAITVVGVILAVASSGLTAVDYSYHGTYGSVPLLVDSTRVLVKYSSSADSTIRDAITSNIPRFDSVISDNDAPDDFKVFHLTTGVGYLGFLDSLVSVADIDYAEPYYTSIDGISMPVGDRFCVRFDESLSIEEIESINQSKGVEVDHELEGMPNVFILRNMPSSRKRVLEIAEEYFDLSVTRYAYPLFTTRIKAMNYRVFDYYGIYQYHLKKVIGYFNDSTVWDFAGLNRPVVVAVLDDGIEPHEDLTSDRILPGWDFIYDVADVSPGPARAHGMGCAGIIGATHERDSTIGSNDANTGISGLNPSCRILPIKVFDEWGSGGTSDEVAEAITWARDNGAEIFSCSWTFGTSHVEFPMVTDALTRAYLFGRGGLGCPLIFAAGNGGTDTVDYPANLDCCLAVGAINLQDERYDYSCYGEDLDVVAPSAEAGMVGSVWTTDRMGTLGFNTAWFGNCPSGSNDADYDCHFGGTSAACPLVSGIASLLISKDSTLNAAAVYWIIKRSAERRLESNWGLPIDTPNAEFGYGRVDAFRVILSMSHGDLDSNGKFNLADITLLINFVYLGGVGGFPSYRLGDIDCDGYINMSDVTLLIAYVYLNGSPPQRPCFEKDSKLP